MSKSSFTFADLVRRSDELNRKKAEIHTLIQMVTGSLETCSANVPVHISHDSTQIGEHKYVWDIGAGHNGYLILVRWTLNADIIAGFGGESELVWSGRDAKSIPATAVDEVYAAMDFLLEQSLKHIPLFRQVIAKLIPA